MVTTAQLNQLLKDCGFRPVDSATAEIVVNHTNAAINDPNEAAMFLGNLLHESAGFHYREEIGKGAGFSYGHTGFHGRGYIQLTHESNYRDASQGIFGDDRLVQNPNLVADSVDVSMRVSVWFWVARVRPGGGPGSNNFGLTRKVINGGESASSKAARNRYRYYREAARIFGVANPASE